MLAQPMMLAEMTPSWKAMGKGDFDTGLGNVRGSAQTLFCALRWNSEWAGRRQWVLNFGQWNGGAEHWLWGGGDSIQFGRWGGPQIGNAPMSGASVLATVYEGSTYKLYLDGKLVASNGNFNLDIQSPVMHVGKQPPGWGESDFNGPIFETQLFMQPLNAGQVESQSLALMAKYADTPDWSGLGKGDHNTGLVIRGRRHTVCMALRWSAQWDERRTWVLNFGQWNGGAEHWLWGGQDSIQFGRWGGPQIGNAPMYGTNVICAVYEGNTYKLYLDGNLAASNNNFNLDIQDPWMHVGKQPPGWGESDFNGPIFETQLFLDPLNADKVASVSLALKNKYWNTPGYGPWGYPEP